MKHDVHEQQLLLKMLDENLAAIAKARKVLAYSIERCAMRNLSADENLESCEALSGRFGRAVDIFTQKLLTTIFLLIGEAPQSFIDKCNLAEKLGIVKSASALITMRRIRNEIVYDYRADNLEDLFAEIAKQSVQLLDIIDFAAQYATSLKNKFRK